MNIEKIINLAAIIILPIVLVIVAPYWSSTFNGYKEIQYDILSSPGINDFGFLEDNWPELKVVFGEKVIIEGGFVLVGIENTGTMPIKKEDFDKAITIKFSDESRVIGFRKISSVPRSLAVENSLKDNTISISPLLLNPGDRFYAEALIDGEASSPEVSTRVFGLKELKKKQRVSRGGIYIGEIFTTDNYALATHKKLYYLNEYVLVFIGFILITVFFALRIIGKENKETEAYETLDFVIQISMYMGSIFAIVIGSRALATGSIGRLSIVIGTVLLGFFNSIFSHTEK